MRPGSTPQAILDVVAQARQREEAELARAERIEAVRVYAQTASGTADIDETFSLNRCFRLVYLRCHFVGGSGRSELEISVDSAFGSAYDARLFVVRAAGVGADVNLRLSSRETTQPSAWSLQPGDTLRLRWTNPDPGNINWGVEVGLAPA